MYTYNFMVIDYFKILKFNPSIVSKIRDDNEKCTFPLYKTTETPYMIEWKVLDYKLKSHLILLALSCKAIGTTEPTLWKPLFANLPKPIITQHTSH